MGEGAVDPGRSRRCFKEIEAECNSHQRQRGLPRRSRRCFKEIEAGQWWRRAKRQRHDAVAAVSKRLRRDGEFFVYGHIGPGRSRRCFKEIEAACRNHAIRQVRRDAVAAVSKRLRRAARGLDEVSVLNDAVAAVSKRLRRHSQPPR